MLNKRLTFLKLRVCKAFIKETRDLLYVGLYKLKGVINLNKTKAIQLLKTKKFFGFLLLNIVRFNILT